MKKKMFAVLSMMLFLAFSTTAFAGAQSPTSKSEVTVIKNQDNSSQETPSYANTASDTPEQKAVTSAAAAAIATSTSESGAVISSRPVSAQEYQTLVATAQNTFPGCQVMAVADINGIIKGGGENITLKVTGIVAGDKVAVIHHGKNGIEVIQPTSVGNGTVTAFFKGLSPVEIVKLATVVDETTAVDATADAQTSTPNKTKSTNTASSVELSPKTGETTTIYFLMVIAMAGIAVCSKFIINKK